MYKFLIIVGIVFYLVYKVGSFFFRAGAAAQQLRNFENQQQQRVKNEQTRKKQQSKPKTGEYIDYEEVK